MLRYMAALMLMAGPAFGLSCQAPNFGQSFNRAVAADEVYSLVYGQLREVAPIPEGVRGQPRTVPMQFVGKVMGANGFSETQTLSVTIETRCAGSWCGTIPTLEKPMLAFFEQREGGLVLTSHACTSDFHLNPSLGQVSAIRACMRAMDCGEDELEAFDLN